MTDQKHWAFSVDVRRVNSKENFSSTSIGINASNVDLAKSRATKKLKDRGYEVKNLVLVSSREVSS